MSQNSGTNPVPHTNTDADKQESYRDQVIRLAQSLAACKNKAVFGDLAPTAPSDRVKMFTDGNFEKRIEKLQKQAEFVKDGFPHLDELIVDFMKSAPLAAYDTGASDGERLLAWIERTQNPTPEQRDYIACQRARYAIEDVARLNRMGYLRFQELLSTADTLSNELDTNRRLKIHLNPIRVWSRFETKELLDEEATVPADVLFYPVSKDVRTAVLEDDSQERVRELASYGPCTVDEWLAQLEPFVGQEGVTRHELVSLIRDLAEIGLVAFA